jgi:hypothetical protein
VIQPFFILFIILEILLVILYFVGHF